MTEQSLINPEYFEETKPFNKAEYIEEIAEEYKQRQIRILNELSECEICELYKEVIE